MTTIRYPTATPLGSLLGATPYVTESAEAYRATGGYAGVTVPDELLHHLDSSDLRGRGGAGFPAAVKLRAARERGAAGAVAAPIVNSSDASAHPTPVLKGTP
ncbi:hypothetical protein ACIGEZ_23605 [Streptomyces sp. NPDC085481]|uniref:hypothetical protein n=1 Tax=Streptomyces sp. NPDC085481 TaxID=3365727 RepID=UPI0037D098E9